MRKLHLFTLAICLLSSTAQAATISLTFNNKSGQAVNVVTATPKSGGDAQSLLPASLAAGAKSTISFASPGTACVFTLTYTLGNGKTTTVPDTDLCQTDQIIIQ